MPIIAFATYSEVPKLTSDDQLGAAALEKLAAEVVPVVWDDPHVDWEQFDAIVVRSCWDYHLKHTKFSVWLEALERLSVPILNSPQTSRWNLNKTYLHELAEKGVGIPKTLFCSASDPTCLSDLLQKNNFSEVVLKPSVSLNGYNTWRSSVSEAALDQSQWSNLIQKEGMMIQEFIPEVLTEGELSFVFFAGTFSHCVRKRATRKGEFRIHEEYGGTREFYLPTPQMLAEAEMILSKVTPTPAIARVDVVPVNDSLVLIELGLIDPMLYLQYDPTAPMRFARSVQELLRF